MKLSMLSLIILAWVGLIREAIAVDYVLDASVLEVGVTAGENFVVKEGCFDPSKATCIDKIRWFSSISPAKVGSVQVSGQFYGSFEVVITADFAKETKTINLLTANNKGIYLKFNGDASNYLHFSPNELGEGGGYSYGYLPGWNKDFSFNEVKISVQQGVANVYTNGKVHGKPITFDAGVVFSRVTIEGIKSDDRLSDIRVRCIQGTTACNSTETGTTPTTTIKIDGIATNGMVTPNNKMIAGVLISGGTKRTMVRASSVDGAVDPFVEIYTYPDRKLLGNNDSWAFSPVATELTQKKLAPARVTDAATIINLPAGLFTMEVSSKNGGSGATVIEVYDMAVFP